MKQLLTILSLFLLPNLFAQSNLMKRSEQLDYSLVWNNVGDVPTANVVADPNGNVTAELITCNASGGFHNLYEAVPVTAGVTYTFSFYALRGTMTDLKYSVWDEWNIGDIAAPTSYYSLTNSSTWTRVSVTFTAPALCKSVRVYVERDSHVNGTVYIWGAQLNTGSSPSTYQQTVDFIYYIDNLNGDDNNDGRSMLFPWKTLTKVNNSGFTSDDQILIKRGQKFREILRPPSTGTLGHPIVIGSYGTGSLPMISGADSVTTWTNYSGNIWKSYIHITTINTSDSILYNVDFNDVTGTKRNSIASLVLSKDWYWHNDTLYIYSSGSPNSFYRIVEPYVRENCIRVEGQSYFTLQDVAAEKSRIDGVFISRYGSTATNILVQRLYVRKTGVNTNVGSNNNQFPNGISLAADHMTVQNCLLDSCGWNGITTGPPSNGNAIGITIQDNECYHGNHNGIDFKSVNSNIDSANTMDYFYIDSVIVRRNKIHDNNGTQSNGIYIQQTFGKVANVQVYQNLVYNNFQQGITLVSSTGHFIDSSTVYNNTVAGNGNIGYQLSLTGNGTVFNNIAYNNNYLGITTSELKLFVSGTSYPTTDYNLVYNSTNNTCYRISSTAYDLAGYRTVTGNEAHGISINPQLTSNYSLKGNSPAIDAGTNTGLAFRGSGQDIGYREFGTWNLKGNVRIIH